MTPEDVDLSAHLGIDPETLDGDVRSRLETYVAAREQRLVELRERAIDAEQETQALQARVQSLQEQLTTLEEQVGRTDADSLHLEPTTVLSSFGDALEQEQVQQSGFTVSDISVDLRANVVNTDAGVRLQLPGPGTSLPEGTLSELRFSVRRDEDRPELAYEEVPDLVGMDEATAREAITETGFTVGSVETVPADEPAGRVVGQLPSPFSLADPGAPVDLEVAEAEPVEMVDLVGERLSDAVRFVGDRFTLHDIETVESDEPPGTVVEQDPDPGVAVSLKDRFALTVAEFRDRRDLEEAESPAEAEEDEEEGAAGGADAEARVARTEEGEEAAAGEEAEEAADADEAAEGRAGPAEGRAPRHGLDEPMTARRAERLLDAMDAGAVAEDAEPLVEQDVTEINGIGDTYGQRLRNGGIESLADLAVAEPIEVADAANVSRDRARDWIEAVRARLDVRTGGDGRPEAEEESER